ncbi:MAG TPA: hypothetical protein VFR41_00950 [Acidimicrobiia bacterium]|nr:hypothetical protein [Acidimicrobiia bacterium]
MSSCSRDDLPTTAFSFASQSGDYIGQGQSHIFGADSFTVTVTGTTADVSLHVSGGGEFWTAELAAPRGQTLHQGAFPGAVRAVSRTGTQPGMDIWGDGRGCNPLTGDFTIYEICADNAGNVTQFDAVANQHCEGQAPNLLASLRYNATPMNLNLTSDAGDYVGQGMSKLYDGDTSVFGLTSYGSNGGFVYTASGLSDNWTAIITPPTGGTLAKGQTYTTLRFANVTNAGLDFFGDGRGCNQSSGKMTINALQRDGSGAITALNVTLEQHCENAVPALHATIRYNA